MNIIEEDLVDWEPLQMRFVPQAPLSPEEAQSLARFISNWFDTSAENDPDLWHHAKEWCAYPVDNGEVEAFCELMPGRALRSLADAVASAFPTIAQLRIGHALEGPTNCLEFDWIELPGGTVNVAGELCHVSPFTITFTPVTVGQFREFLDATSYKPVPDIIESDGFLIGHFQTNFGPSPKPPLMGVTLDDALAFCEWGKFRLPTDAERAHFFESAVRQGRKFSFAGACWTSVSTSPDHFITRDGPLRVDGLADDTDQYRKELHRHYHELYGAPCFRVVKAE